jgi:uncharacterized membrane protein
MWFLIACAGYGVLAVVLLLDKVIVSQSRVRPLAYTAYSTLPSLLAFAVLPFGAGLLAGWDWWWAIFSGIAFGLSLLFLFLSLRGNETSHIGPFGGAVAAMAIGGLSAAALGESLSPSEWAGGGMLVAASFLLSFEKTRTGSGRVSGYVFAIVAALFGAASIVSAKYLYELYPFLTVLMWTKSTPIIVGILCLLSPSVRGELFGRRPKEKIKTFERRHRTALVVADKMLGGLGVVLIQYAIAVGSATLVGAMVGVQYIVLFLMIVVLTRFAPRVFREYITPREYVVETGAIALIAFGSVLLVI